MKKFYYHNGREQFGPYDILELKSLNITRDTPIWFDGLNSWQPAGNINELKSLFHTPPDFKVSSPPLKHSTAQSAGFHIGKSIGGYFWLLLFIGILVPASMYLYNRLGEQKQENARQEEIDVRKNIRDHITTYVYAERSDYQYRAIGGIFNLKVSVNNNTDYILDNVKVKVNYIKPNGDVWDDKIVDFNLINPHTKMTIPVENTSRGVRVNYEIVSIKSTALGI